MTVFPHIFFSGNFSFLNSNSNSFNFLLNKLNFCNRNYGKLATLSAWIQARKLFKGGYYMRKYGSGLKKVVWWLWRDKGCRISAPEFSTPDFWIIKSYVYLKSLWLKSMVKKSKNVPNYTFICNYTYNRNSRVGDVG